MDHHGVWDYDLAAPPNLLDLRSGDGIIPAVALATKQGFVFVFDRVTGNPIWPIDERPVPQSTVPGERTSATQPFPTRPPPFERQGVGVDDLIDFTPELRAAALELVEGVELAPLYTPPARHTVAAMPSALGGANWPGAAVDPEYGVLYVPSISIAAGIKLVEQPRELVDFRYSASLALPLLLSRESSPQVPLPVTRPPYSQVTAIDLNEGEVLWQTPLGNGPRTHPELVDLGLPPLGSAAQGCALVTRTLVIVSEGEAKFRKIAGEPKLWAYDKRSGAVVGEVRLPATPRGCPVTYEIGDRQHIAIPIADAEHPPALVSLRLPR